MEMSLQMIAASVPSMIISGMALLAIQEHFLVSEKSKELKRSSNGKLYKFIDRTLTDIEEVIVLRIKDAAKLKWMRHMCPHGETEQTCEYFGKYYPNEVGKAIGIMHNTLTKQTRSSIIQHIDINHFHDMSEKDLKDYIDEVGEELHTDNHRAIRIAGMDDIPLVAGQHGEWFSVEEAQEQWGKIARESIRLKHEYKQLLREYRREISKLRRALSVLKGVIGK